MYAPRSGHSDLHDFGPALPPPRRIFAFHCVLYVCSPRSVQVAVHKKVKKFLAVTEHDYVPRHIAERVEGDVSGTSGINYTAAVQRTRSKR